jgi:hypothetical protein
MAPTVLLNQSEGSWREHEGEEERAHQQKGLVMARKQMQQVFLKKRMLQATL